MGTDLWSGPTRRVYWSKVAGKHGPLTDICVCCEKPTPDHEPECYLDRLHQRLYRIRSILADPFVDISDLEPEERASLCALARGQSVSDVATQFKVTPRTVYRIARRGLRKLNRAVDRQPGNEIQLEDLTAVAFQILERAADTEVRRG